MSMQTLTYQVSFSTPAFLGNAEQQAQWRTPPFKAMLRQWWRVVKAPDVGYDHKELLRLENDLFGSAGNGDEGGRSKVQLRLSDWQDGTLSKEQIPQLAWVAHDEVDPRNSPPHKGEKKVRADVYLGYGPIGRSSAIASGNSSHALKIRTPVQHGSDIAKAMQLAAWFGTLGSRARNGWGSLHIEGEGLLGLEGLCDSKLAEQVRPRPVADALNDRLAGQWPHALGLCSDTRPAVWRVVAGRDEAQGKYLGFAHWREVMERLAALKIGFRTHFKFDSGAPHNRVEKRHILAYPVTNHGLAGLPNARLANQLRLKVVKDKQGQHFGLITHLPCAMPHAFFERSTIRPPEINTQIEVWQQVHQFLNSRPAREITRIRKA